MEGKTMTAKQKAACLLFASSLYLLCPVDFIPDIAPGIGNFDDLLVMLFGTSRYFAVSRVIELKK